MSAVAAAAGGAVAQTAQAQTRSVPKIIRRAFLFLSLLGLVVAIVDMRYSARFGATIDDETMVGLAAISLASSFLLIAVVALYRMDYKPIAKAMLGVFGICFAFNIISNMGVATSTRMGEVQKAHLVAGQFKDKTKARDDAEARLKIFDQNLVELQADFRKLTTVKVGDWQVTAMPPSVPDLDNLIAEKEAERAREAGRVKCGPICEQRAREKQHLIALRGIAVKIAEKESQIAATKRVLADARKTVKTADAGISSTNNQSTLYAKWIGPIFGEVKKDKEGNVSLASIQTANEGMGIMMAFVIAFASMGLSLTGAWPALMEINPSTRMFVAYEKVKTNPHDDDDNGGSSGGGLGALMGEPQAPATSVPAVPAAAPANKLPVTAVTVGQLNMARLEQWAKQQEGLLLQ